MQGNTIHAQLTEASIRLRSVLVAAQEERSKRPNLISAPGGGTECEWVRFERNAMWGEVNRIRDERGLRPISLGGILRVEQQAAGHSDYTGKFAFYCAELAIAEGPDEAIASFDNAGLAEGHD